jgi:cyanate lyase
LDPRFAGSNLAEDDEFLKEIKIGSTTSFGEEVKPSVPFIVRFYGMLKNPSSMKRNTS